MKGIYAQKTLSEINESGTSEHELWVAVLSKAAHDAIYGSDWREALPIKRREAHMSMIRNGGRLYVAETRQLPKQHRSHYRGTGTRKRGRPRLYDL